MHMPNTKFMLRPQLPRFRQWRVRPQGSLRICKTSVSYLLEFSLHWELRCNSNRSFFIWKLTFFLVAFNTNFVLYIECFDYIVGGFLFWPNLFVVLQATCTFIGISFFTLGKFSFTILLKIFSVTSVLIILRIGLFTMPLISWIL